MTRRLAPLGGSDLVVQAMAPSGVACVVRSVEDPLFGPVVSFGVGGDATELLGDYAHRIPPLTDRRRARPDPLGPGGAEALRPPGRASRSTSPRSRTSSRGSPASPTTCRRSRELELNPVVVARGGRHVLGAVVRLVERRGAARTPAAAS